LQRVRRQKDIPSSGNRGRGFVDGMRAFANGIFVTAREQRRNGIGIDSEPDVPDALRDMISDDEGEDRGALRLCDVGIPLAKVVQPVGVVGRLEKDLQAVVQDI
jgi:hypothetical protein